MNAEQPMLDLDWLLRLRVVVARFGEMDVFRWWNTKGQLGPNGELAVKRGFPRTHFFAQARSVFAVATNRCEEVFNPPSSITLWSLTDLIEEEFEASWEKWIDCAKEWEPFFNKVAAIQPGDLAKVLTDFDLVGEEDLKTFANFRRSAEGRAVPISHIFSGNKNEISLLALGFARGEVGALAVPYMQRKQ
jgi:hypothetical protein